MEIKKDIIAGIIYLALIISGLFLIINLFEELARIGAIGYLMLWIFILSLYWVRKYERSIKYDAKLAEQIAEKVVEEYEEQFKNIPEEISQELKSRDLHKGGFTTTDQWKDELTKHLAKKTKDIGITRKSILDFIGETILITIIFGLLAILFSPK